VADNKVLKFFIKLFAVILTASIIVGVINSFYIKGYYYMDTYGEIENMKDVPYDLQMINLGTSHGLASFHYPENGIKSYNLALSGEDIYHDFQTLKQFSDHLSKGCVVAIVTSYFSFCMPTDVPSQKRYYLYLDKDKIKDFTYETLISAKYVPVLRSGEYIIKDLINDQEMDVGAEMMKDKQTTSSDNQSTEVTTAVIETVQNQQDELMQKRNARDGELTDHAVGRAESWRSGYMINGKRFIAENTELVKEIVQFCYDNGFKPVLVSTPIYYALNEQFTDEELNRCYFDNLKKVQSEMNVPYYDLSHDAEMSVTPEYFSNSDHLNNSGATAFMEKYLSYLKEINYIK